MTLVHETTRILEEYLEEFNPNRTKDGAFVVRRGSASCQIWVEESSSEDVVVVFEAPVIYEAPMTKDLVDLYISLNQDTSLFTHVLLTDGKTAILALRYALRGADLRKDDVTHATRLLVETADLIDEAAQARCGGKLSIDYFS